MAPTVHSRQKPAKRESEPPEEGGHHGIVQKNEDHKTGGIFPGPSGRSLDEVVAGARELVPAHHHGQEVAESVYHEAESEVDDGAPGVLEPRGVEEKGENGDERRQKADEGEERDPSEREGLLLLGEVRAVPARATSVHRRVRFQRRRCDDSGRSGRQRIIYEEKRVK